MAKYHIFLPLLAFTLLPMSQTAKGSISACDAVIGNLVQNCGFENQTNPSGWNIWTFSGPVDDGYGGNFYGTQTAPFPVNSGSWAAYFGADTTINPSTQTLSQTLTVVAGAQYSLQFFLDQNGPSVELGNSLVVSFGGQTVHTFTNLADTNGFVVETFTISAPVTNPTLSFAFDNLDDFFYLDDVTVLSESPEPKSILLVAPVLGALLFAASKKRTAKTRGAL